ncbi:MAG: transketolase [Coriobacteriia bacterium]|nr:transketolase [Coriobacteriia bacterium]
MSREELIRVADKMRCNVVRMLTEAGSGHPGGSLSAAEIMSVLWFGGIMRYRADDPAWGKRDRFVLSKGHVAPILYAAMAQAGFLEESELLSLRKLGGRLQGHPDCLKLPGVEVSTGSLGQGLSIATGMALGLALNGGDQKVFCLIGDGECQEGQIWEAVLYAATRKVKNLIAIVDNNGLQIDGAVKDICDLGNLAKKFSEFGWLALEVDGHDVDALYTAFDEATSSEFVRPRVIIAHTIKGRGVSFMENSSGWHGKTINVDQCKSALLELGEELC